MLVVSDFTKCDDNPNGWIKNPACPVTMVASMAIMNGMLRYAYMDQYLSPPPSWAPGVVHKVQLKANSICHIYAEAMAGPTTQAYVYVGTCPECENVKWQTQRVPIDSPDPPPVSFYFGTKDKEEYYIGVLISEPKKWDTFFIEKFVVAGFPT